MTANPAETRPRLGARRLGQIPALDGVRGLAVLIVVVFHIAAANGFDQKPLFIPNTPVALDLRLGLTGGWLGVDIFFVLSGFLITAILLDEQALKGRVRLGAFYIRRALRLFPALYALLAIYGIYSLTTGLPYTAWWQSTLSVSFYYSNWLSYISPGTTSPPGMGILWSLAVEEQFYLIWPAVLFLFFGMNRRPRVVIPGMIALIMIVAIYRAMLVDSVSWVLLLTRTDTRIDSLFVGALLAQLWVRNLTPRRGLRIPSTIALGIIGVLVIIGKVQDPRWYQGGLTIIALLIAVVILGIIEGVWQNGGVFGNRILRLLGRVSYGLYIWHALIIHAVNRYGVNWMWWERLIVCLATIAMAVSLSWFCIEAPALRLKRRWEVRGIGPLPLPGQPDAAVSGHPAVAASGPGI